MEETEKKADDSVDEVFFCLFVGFPHPPVVSNCNQTSTNCFDLEDSEANRSDRKRGGRRGLLSTLKCNFLKL